MMTTVAANSHRVEAEMKEATFYYLPRIEYR